VSIFPLSSHLPRSHHSPQQTLRWQLDGSLCLSRGCYYITVSLPKSLLTFSPLGPESPLRPGSPGGPCGKRRWGHSPCLRGFCWQHPSQCNRDITHHGARRTIWAWGSWETLLTLKHRDPQYEPVPHTSALCPLPGLPSPLTTGPGIPRRPSGPGFPGAPWGPMGPVFPGGPSKPASPCREWDLDAWRLWAPGSGPLLRTSDAIEVLWYPKVAHSPPSSGSCPGQCPPL
jgi:hypothetical protein